jgi:FtsP/CotA-like multicopper oxidase with cupredoxin domain
MAITLSRRAVLAGGGGACALAAASAYLGIKYGAAQSASPPIEKFARVLPIPPVLRPVRADTEADFYVVSQQAAQLEILPGLKTTVWGYNGLFPGPTIRVRRGRRAVVTQINRLRFPTSVHLHGGATPSDSDGFPTDLIVPNDFPTDIPLCSAVGSVDELRRDGVTATNSKIHHYPNRQRAATLWYHDHAMDFTGRNVYMGLAGFYIIEDDEDAALGLPSGSYDVPLMLCLRQFDARGAFVYDNRGHLGAQGDVVLVNGTPWPRMVVARRKYRFRILNAANATPVTLALSSGKPFVQIATDGGLLPAPLVNAILPLAMAERVEIVIDFAAYAPGTKLVLHNIEGVGGLADIMRFDISGPTSGDEGSLPDRLSDSLRLQPSSAVARREFKFTNDFELTLNLPPVAWDINGKAFDPDRVDAAPRLDSTEIWHFIHPRTMFPGVHVHPVHVHLVQFQILDRNGGPPHPHETGWKDTVRLAEGDDVHVVARFAGYRGRYVLHCHNLGHEDHYMMARFDVV